MPHTANNKRRILVIGVIGGIAALLVGLAVMYATKSDRSAARGTTKAAPRPAADSPRGVIWDLWHAAVDDDHQRVRAALLAISEPEQRTADALAELLCAEAAFARQLQHTWPMSPISRDGAGTWFGEGGDIGLLTARQSIDAAAIHATVNMHGTPIKLTHTGGAWKIDTTDLARSRLKRNRNDGRTEDDLANVPQQLSAMAAAYRTLRAEVAALHIASPSAAVEQLRQSMPATGPDAGRS